MAVGAEPMKFARGREGELLAPAPRAMRAVLEHHGGFTAPQHAGIGRGVVRTSEPAVGKSNEFVREHRSRVRSPREDRLARDERRTHAELRRARGAGAEGVRVAEDHALRHVRKCRVARLRCLARAARDHDVESPADVDRQLPLEFVLLQQRLHVCGEERVGAARTRRDEGWIVAMHIRDHETANPCRRERLRQAAARPSGEALAHGVHHHDVRARIEQHRVEGEEVIAGDALHRSGRERRSAAREQHQHLV